MSAIPSTALWSSSSSIHTRSRDYGAAMKRRPEGGGSYTGQGLQTASLMAYSHRTAEKKMSGYIPVVSQKRANLLVKKDKLVELPEWASSAGPSRSFGSFLHNSEGMESVLNIKSLSSMEPLGENVYRCTLPQLEFMDFQVSPVLDLYVASSETDCIVEMLSCKFQGSKEVERQNERFSASMKNHITWDADRTVNVHVELKLSLEVYTFPFTHLPISAVERPGHAILQACLDRMMPAFASYLIEDYKRWVDKQSTNGQLRALEQVEAETRIQNGSIRTLDDVSEGLLALSSESN